MDAILDQQHREVAGGAVRFSAVTKRFGEVAALDGVSMSIRQGEFMTLLGPSGCGKTTLLNLAAGFLGPDSGEILIAGERMNDVPTYKREIGMMFQNYALFPHMNVAGNVAYGLKVRGVPKGERDRRVEAVLGLPRLEGIEGAFAVVAVGTARVKVPGGPLAEVARSSPVDLFVRPEHLAISEATEASATSGTIATHVYQGVTSIPTWSLATRPAIGCW
jgi:ABC-type taurine transport system ATPase subunit